MKISSISLAAATLLAGKASASTPPRLRAMTEDIAANATSASTGTAGITEDDLLDRLASLNLPPFFQAMVKPDNATESQFFEDLIDEDELSSQFDFLDAGPSSMSMSMAGSTAAAPSSGSGGVRGWDSKSGKGDNCSIEKMRGSYEFKYDLWISYPINGVWGATTYFPRERGVLLNFGRPDGPSGQPGRGRGAMVGLFCLPDVVEYAVAVQTGVSQKDVVPFQVTMPDSGPEVSFQGEFNCKTEEVYFGVTYYSDSDLTFGFTTRNPAKKTTEKVCTV